MINQLVADHFDFLEGDSLFNAFDTVMKMPGKFKTQQSRDMIEKLYFQLVQISESDDIFTDEQTAILDLYYSAVYLQTSLFTDDTFQFNEVIRELQGAL